MYTKPGLAKLALFLFFLTHAVVYAQQETADSLKRVLGFSNDTTRVELLLQLTDAYLKFSPPKALDPANEARMLSTQLGNERLEAKALLALGKVNYKIGNFNEAISSYEQSRQLYLQLGMKDKAAAVLIVMADANQAKGNYNDALNNSLDAYKENESLGNKNGMSSALIISGNVYKVMKNYDEAITDYEKALTLAKEGGDKSLQASCMNNLSNVYGDKGDTAKAISYLQQSKEIYISLDDKFGLSKVLNNIGAVYYEMGDLDKASDYFLQALEIRKQIGDKRGMTSTLANLGSVSQEQGKPDKAVEYFNRALDISKNIGVNELQMSILKSLSECYEDLGDTSKALDFQKKYADLKDSVFSENLSNSIAEMQAKYKVEEAESATRAEQEQNKIITISAVGGGILLLVIVFILWNRAVIRKRTNIKLNAQNEEIERKNEALYSAKQEIELKNKDITDSIVYARKIQEAIFPEVEFHSTFGDGGFVFYRPKDIVSGDFYWMAQTPDLLMFAAVDCTGHGVPGAFVSIVCSNLLSQSVKEHGMRHPHDILNDVNLRLSETLRQRQDESRVRDGMDIALCVLDKKTLKMEFAGAFNPAWIFRGNQFNELPGDKLPVGLFLEEELRKFSMREFQLRPGDRIYLFSDGYSDQFGGENGKKYKRSTFVEFLTGIQDRPIHEHRKLLEQEHLRWKGKQEQIDDILVMGVQV